MRVNPVGTGSSLYYRRPRKVQPKSVKITNEIENNVDYEIVIKDNQEVNIYHNYGPDGKQKE